MKSYKFTINGTKYSVDINNVEDETIQLELNGKPYTIEVEKQEEEEKPQVAKIVKPTAASSTTPSGGGKGVIKSPLPGVVIDVLVKVGDHVTVGQNVLMLEAMKMENNIQSELEGTITEIKVNKGDSLMEGDTLMVIG